VTKVRSQILSYPFLDRMIIQAYEKGTELFSLHQVIRDSKINILTSTLKSEQDEINWHYFEIDHPYDVHHNYLDGCYL